MCKYGDPKRVTFKSDTGVIGIIIMYETGIDYVIIDADDEEKELISTYDESIVATRGTWAVY